jgi:PAS domain S-box-containing protein
MNGPVTNTLSEAAASPESAKPVGTRPLGSRGRRLLFLVLLVPLVTGLLAALGWLAGWYGPLVFAGLWSVLSVAAGSALVWRETTWLDATEKAHREGEDIFRTAVDMAPNGILMVDADGRIILTNRQVETIFGYEPGELLGRPVESLLPERYRRHHVADRNRFFGEPVARAMGSGRDLYALRKDGREVPVEIGLAPVIQAGRSCVLASIIDITERKRSEAELRRSNEELEQFAYVASHDLQEPLRMVSAYTQLLSERYRGRFDEKADRFLAFAADGAIRMQRLLEDLLSYSRVNTRGQPLVSTSLDEVLDRVLAHLQLSISQSGATITRDPLPVVRADSGQMEHVFLNLLGNALKFRGNEAPAIHVGAESTGQQVRIYVKDNGIGIDPRYAERIFVIFQRLHQRGKYPGTGVGLAICKRIVERHGGRIWVESAPGKGATFHFTLQADTAGRTRAA